MAEGGKRQRSFQDSFNQASGDADELFCDPCKGDDEWKAVVGYCPKCDEYLCDNCLRVHRKQKITKAHAILDKKQMPTRQESLSNQDMCVDICNTHHPEIIRFYCTAHDEPGCGDCMTLKHATCKKDRVQDISDGFQKTKEFKDIEHQLQQIHQELEQNEGELDNNLKNLETTYNNILRKIASARQQINVYLDQIQKKITDEAAQMKKEDETELKTLKAHNQSMKAEIEAMLHTLHDSNVNVNSLFVITKQAKHRLIAMEKAINKIKQSQQQTYDFQISNEIEKIVSTKTPLGKLSRKSTQKIKKMTKTQSQRRPQTRNIDTTETYNRTPSIDITAQHNRSICVKCKTNEKYCFINDCTLISPERLVITDGHNKQVKLIDLSNNKLISSYSTLSEPWGVTTLSTNIVAVTLPKDSKIQVLNITGTSTFTLKHEIKVNNKCNGIAYKDGKLAVSCVKPGRVQILDIQGTILHTIQPTGDQLQDPAYITFGHDTDTLIVSDWKTNKVSVLSFRGQTIRTYTHDNLRKPSGIVITGDGLMFVCSWGDGCIHVVSPDFKTSNIIIDIPRDTHIVNARCITCCDTNHTLYISNTGYDESNIYNQIQVYDLNVKQ